jgi:hypothetical protein
MLLSNLDHSTLVRFWIRLGKTGLWKAFALGWKVSVHTGQSSRANKHLIPGFEFAYGMVVEFGTGGREVLGYI